MIVFVPPTSTLEYQLRNLRETINAMLFQSREIEEELCRRGRLQAGYKMRRTRSQHRERSAKAGTKGSR